MTTFARSVPKQFAAAVVVALMWFGWCFQGGGENPCWMRGENPQCGLSWFHGVLMGVIGVLAILLVSGVVIGIAAYRRDGKLSPDESDL